MVRVGGGWMALDEFLVKNDPCRGKTCLIFLSTNKTYYFNKNKKKIYIIIGRDIFNEFIKIVNKCNSKDTLNGILKKHK